MSEFLHISFWMKRRKGSERERESSNLQYIRRCLRYLKVVGEEQRRRSTTALYIHNRKVGKRFHFNASNQKVEENKISFQFNLTFREVLSGQYVDGRKGLWTFLTFDFEQFNVRLFRPSTLKPTSPFLWDTLSLYALIIIYLILIIHWRKHLEIDKYEVTSIS